MKYLPIDSKLFAENRKKFVKKMAPNSVAIFNSNDLMPRSADQDFDFRQNSDLFWLTGIDQEETTLILFPDSKVPGLRELLFLRESNEYIAVWEGHKYTKEEATKASGIKAVYWNDDLDLIINTVLNAAESCYLNMNEHLRYQSEVPYKDLRFANELKHKFPLQTFLRAAPIMHGLRAIKSKTEIELLQKACNITNDAFKRVCGFIKPGVWEYEIEAEIQHEFLRQRATGPAYHSIIASGKNACVLHYVDNNERCKKGDLILMDFGAEYGNYCADMTRTIPVSGTFSKRQKEVYNAVLRIMKKATSLLVPGTNLLDYEKKVAKLYEKELLKLKLISKADVKNQDPKNPAYKKYAMHGTSHYLGLDVHDVGGKSDKLKPGMVFTVEPGIYIPKEKMGIRIENDVVVTRSKPKDLMGHIPREVEEIEDWMNS